MRDRLRRESHTKGGLWRVIRHAEVNRVNSYIASPKSLTDKPLCRHFTDTRILTASLAMQVLCKSVYVIIRWRSGCIHTVHGWQARQSGIILLALRSAWCRLRERQHHELFIEILVAQYLGTSLRAVAGKAYRSVQSACREVIRDHAQMNLLYARQRRGPPDHFSQERPTSPLSPALRHNVHRGSIALVSLLAHLSRCQLTIPTSSPLEKVPKVKLSSSA